jgi:long-chain acyl-CoA synthetase
MLPRNLYTILSDSAARHGDDPALFQRAPGGWRSWSWNEYLAAAGEVAAGLREIGIRKGDIVALDSETCAEFYLADFGILTAGAVAAALYPNYPVPDLARSIQACSARAVFVEDPETFAALRQSAAELAVVWILLKGAAHGALALEELRAAGRAAIAREPALVERIAAETGPADYAILYLTSGATGEPKMGLVTHGSVLENLEIAPHVFNFSPSDSTVAFLPAAHIIQRLVVEILPAASGMPVWFAGSLSRLAETMMEARPTLLVAPPRLWERVHASIRTELRKQPRAVQLIAAAALRMAIKAERLRERGKRPPAHVRALLNAADSLIFRKMRARFGGRLRLCGSGAAPLGKELNDFFRAIGIPLIQGYGLTEGGIVVVNPLARPKAGSIGTPLPGIELRLAPDGELLIRGGTLFSGYWNDPQATAQVLRDGWLHTGDLAEIDAEGYVSITGRKKDIIIASSGKKIYPARIEALFQFEPVVSNVLLAGEGRPYVSALITVNIAAARALDGMQAVGGAGEAAVALAPPVVREVRRAVARVNAKLAPFEQIRRFRLLDRDFSIEAGELTPTMKVRRARALENHRDTVADLYR